MSRKNSYYYNSFSLGSKNHLSRKIVLDENKTQNFNSQPIINNIHYNYQLELWKKMPAGKPKDDFKLANVDPLKKIVDIGTPAFRNKPNAIKGYRKTLECCDKTKPKNKRVTQIYEDVYTNCVCDISFNNRKSKQPIIKSGMQHKKLPKYLIEGKRLQDYKKTLNEATVDVNAKKTVRDNEKTIHDNLPTTNPGKAAAKVNLDTAQQNLDNSIKLERLAKEAYEEIQIPTKIKYNYSYREYLINKRKTGENEIKSGGKNACKDQQCIPKYPGGFQNYTGNGAVTSGLRITNLKLNAIRGGSRCANDPKKCNGVYFAGKPRWTGWMFNKKHSEINFPQLKAKRRTYSLFTGSGLFEKKLKKTGNKNDGSCCGGKPLFDITGCCS
jgi:hypothetical protein